MSLFLYCSYNLLFSSLPIQKGSNTMKKLKRILYQYRQIKNSTSDPYKKPYEFRNMTDYQWYKKCCRDVEANYGISPEKYQSYLNYWFHKKKSDLKLLLSIVRYSFSPRPPFITAFFIRIEVISCQTIILLLLQMIHLI